MNDKNNADKHTLHDRFINYIKNNKTIVGIIIIVSVLVGGKEAIESTEFIVVKANTIYRYAKSYFSKECSEVELTPKEYSECVLKQQ